MARQTYCCLRCSWKVSSLIEHAIRAIQKGFHVFPVEPMDKVPARDGNHTIRWSEYATNVPGRVVQQWQHWPRANVGIACAPSGLLVVDCDTPKTPFLLKGTPMAWLHDRYGPYVHGMDVFEVLAKSLGISLDTYSVTTGSGGTHLYYRWPRSIRASQASLIRGVVDIRCNGGEYGGYVLGDGSETMAGAYTGLFGESILNAPLALVELCREKPRVAAARSPFRQPYSGDVGGLQKAIILAAEGNRNNVLHWAACCMRDDGHAEEATVEALSEPAERVGLTQLETRATISSVYRRC